METDGPDPATRAWVERLRENAARLDAQKAAEWAAYSTERRAQIVAEGEAFRKSFVEFKRRVANEAASASTGIGVDAPGGG